MKNKTGIIGCGRAGTHLAFHLKEKNWPLYSIWDKDEKKAEELSRITGVSLKSLEETIREADIVVLALPDNSIEGFSRKIAEERLIKKGHIVFHLSGSQNADILDAVKKEGAFTASLHPLQSFSVKLNKNNPFKGILISSEGDPEGVKKAGEIADKLEARARVISSETKTLYHAAAVVASNYLVTLMDMAFELIQLSGIKKKESLDFLKPLIMGTLDNLEKMPTENALSGPVTRGDFKTIEQHIRAIEEKNPENLELYRKLGLATLRLAEKNDSFNKESKEELLKVLKQED